MNPASLGMAGAGAGAATDDVDANDALAGNGQEEDEWMQTTDESGRIYFYNRTTRDTRWEPPTGYEMAPEGDAQ